MGIVVSNGKPNPLETMIEEDRGYVGCLLGSGTDCAGDNLKGSGCCAPGLSCTGKKNCPYGRRCLKRLVCETARKMRDVHASILCPGTMEIARKNFGVKRFATLVMAKNVLIADIASLLKSITRG